MYGSELGHRIAALTGRRGLIILVVVGVMLVTDVVVLAVHLSSGNGSHPAALAHRDPPGAGHEASGSPLPQPSSRKSPVTGVTAPGSGCSTPSFVSDNTVAWDLGPYFVSNDEWNAAGFSISQVLYACSYSDWYVDATMNYDHGSHAVKTYPDAGKNFEETPVGSFSSLISTFAETSPHVGIHEDAYDIWLNGVAVPGSTEIMIWNDNFNQRPRGSEVTVISLGGHTYQVWKDGSYIAFVADTNFTSGTMNLLQFFQWVTAMRWMPATASLWQIDYGIELVSTGGVPATFTVSNFSVHSS
jgi:hypothetical protein